MLVFDRVFASTRLTITAQYRWQLPSPEGRLPATTTDPDGTRPYVTVPLARSKIFVLWPMNTPMPSTLFSSTITPSTTSERAPMKQLSSMIVGFAWIGSSTPPMPTPPERCTLRPICAHEPTVAQVSTIVPSSTYAPMLTNDGMSTTLRAMNAPRRATAGGTTRMPASANAPALYAANFVATLS